MIVLSFKKNFVNCNEEYKAKEKLNLKKKIEKKSVRVCEEMKRRKVNGLRAAAVKLF